MDNQLYSFEQYQQQPVESASGTTSPDNSNSGPAAYIVTAICLVFLFIICISVSSCIKDLSSLALPRILDEVTSEIDNERRQQEELTDRMNELDGNSFDDYFEQIFGVPTDDFYGRTGPNSDSSTQKDYSAQEVLQLNLFIYNETIDDMVSASAYAGADTDVKTYVRALALLDSVATEDLVRELRAAGREDEDFDLRITAAHDIATTTIREIEGLDVPDANDATEELVGEAKDYAIERWEQIDALVGLLEDGDTVSGSKLERVDEAIYTATCNAAQALEDALSESAH